MHNAGMARQRVAKGLGGRIEVWQGDITLDDSEAIVNAANRDLMGGGGVDGAIHEAGGSAILEACKEIRRTQYPDGLPAGLAVMTTGGNLIARYVIHTVGPRMGREKGKENELLASAYHNSLPAGEAKGVKTIAFPSISTGIYTFPKQRAAQVAFRVCEKWLKEHEGGWRIRLYFWTNEDARIFCIQSGLRMEIEV